MADEERLSDRKVFRGWYQEALDVSDHARTALSLNRRLNEEWVRLVDDRQETCRIIRLIWDARTARRAATVTLREVVGLLTAGMASEVRQHGLQRVLQQRESAIVKLLSLLRDLHDLHHEKDGLQFKACQELRSYVSTLVDVEEAEGLFNTDWLQRAVATPHVVDDQPSESLIQLAVDIREVLDSPPPGNAAGSSRPSDLNLPSPIRRRKRKQNEGDNGVAGRKIPGRNLQVEGEGRATSANARPQKRRRGEPSGSARAGAPGDLLPAHGIDNVIGYGGYPLVGLPSTAAPPPPPPRVFLGGRNVDLVAPGPSEIYYRTVLDKIHRYADRYARSHGIGPSFVAYCVDNMFQEDGRPVAHVNDTCKLLNCLIDDELPPTFPWDNQPLLDPYRTVHDIDARGPYQQHLKSIVNNDGPSNAFIEYVRRNLDLSDAHEVAGANRIASRILSMYLKYHPDHDWTQEADVSLVRPHVRTLGAQPGFDGRRNAVNAPGIWSFQGQIGEGGNGRAVLYVKHDQGTVVGRCIVKESFLEDGWTSSGSWYRGDRREPRVPQEAGFHRLIPQHPSIVKYLGFGVYNQLRMVRIYTEYCSLGDGLKVLANHIDRDFYARDQSGNKLHGGVPIVAIWAWFELAVAALCLMQHGRVPADNEAIRDFKPAEGWDYELVHRDIKLDNFFLDAAPGERRIYPRIPVFKLGDFGNTVDVKFTTNPESIVEGGTPGIQAPEQIDNHSHEYLPCAATNTWQVGYAMLCLMQLLAPTVESQPRMGNYVLHADAETDRRLASYPEELQNLVWHCLQRLPADRMSCVQLYLHIRREVKAYPPGNHTTPVQYRGIPAGQVVCCGEPGNYVTGFAK